MKLTIISCILLIVQLCWAQDGPTDSTPRLVKRGDIRAALAGKLDPNFWPARGRRSDWLSNDDEDEEDDGNYLNRRDSLLNRGRKTNEEDPGVFWAGRGRNVPMNERNLEEDPLETFWANRGRSTQSDSPDNFVENPQEPGDAEEMDTRWRRHRLFVEEPGWVWLSRREAHLPYDVSFAGGTGGSKDKSKVDLFWVARGKKHKKEKRDVSRFRSDPCWSFHAKRNAKNVIRELSQLNQNHFWPARGKRPLSELFSDAYLSAKGRRPSASKEELPKRREAKE